MQVQVHKGFQAKQCNNISETSSTILMGLDVIMQHDGGSVRWGTRKAYLVARELAILQQIFCTQLPASEGLRGKAGRNNCYVCSAQHGMGEVKHFLLLEKIYIDAFSMYMCTSLVSHKHITSRLSCLIIHFS